MSSVYASLNGHASEVRSLADRIRSSLGCIAEEAIEVGRMLIRAKQIVGHGQFGRWLQEEFRWSERKAQSYMAIAERFGKSAESADLSLSVMVELSAPSVPESAIEEVVDRAKGGEKVTVKAAKQVIREHKPKPSSGKPKAKAADPGNRIADKIAEVYGDGNCGAEVEPEPEPAAAPVPTKRQQFFDLLDSVSPAERAELVAEAKSKYAIELPSDAPEPNQEFTHGKSMLFAELEPDGDKLRNQIKVHDKLEVAQVLFDECSDNQKEPVASFIKSLVAQWKSQSRFTESFEQFWSVYPPTRRTNKSKAFVTWQRTIRKMATVPVPSGEASWEAFIVRRALEYAASPVASTQYVKGPEPWLNGGCWDDHPEAWNRKFDETGKRVDDGFSDLRNSPDPAKSGRKVAPKLRSYVSGGSNQEQQLGGAKARA